MWRWISRLRERRLGLGVLSRFALPARALGLCLCRQEPFEADRDHSYAYREAHNQHKADPHKKRSLEGVAAVQPDSADCGNDARDDDNRATRGEPALKVRKCGPR
jgi:hypothetical protein